MFEGALAGLMLCEAEAESVAVIQALLFPAWTHRDVTAEPFFTGGALSRIDADGLRDRLAVEFSSSPVNGGG